MFYFAFRLVVLVPLLRWVFRPRVEGAGRVPGAGAVILAGNHQSFTDQFLLGVTLRRRLTFLAKQEYFTAPGLTGRATAAFFRALGQIPVDRSGKDAARAALDTALQVLDGGGVLGVFPEGTRSHDGRLYKGKVGVAAMALRSGAPVVPVAMIGTFEAQPKGRRLPRRVPITIRFGEPLDFSRYAGMENQRLVLRAVTDEIMYAVRKLSEQEYVDVYAAEARTARAAGAAVA
ncbi:lysophospholipid acyltransferase family protein [Streptomyces sp. NPDC001691]|uniref:lysophospholipid acyltransferase family protein n=1 Tax=unclassified Streptomyces TaxID=2593676 RepID=UPI000DE86B74|nr:lysophospholipid acyltransferase family protein [Streptomyces sp. SDr-06]RCH70629.1 1-acyl-sn-glycerol-3-phosphate acyltransferase [Streptomyces sp. SDr-06]